MSRCQWSQIHAKWLVSRVLGTELPNANESATYWADRILPNASTAYWTQVDLIRTSGAEETLGTQMNMLSAASFPMGTGLLEQGMRQGNVRFDFPIENLNHDASAH